MTKKKNSGRGQVMVDFCMTLPLMLLMVNFGSDAVNMIKTAHLMNQAAYEATKLVPQVGPNNAYTPYCGSQPSQKPCLDQAMKERAERVLKDAGLDTTKMPISVSEDFVNGLDGYIYHFLRTDIEFDYAFFGNGTSGISIKKLKARASAVHDRRLQ